MRDVQNVLRRAHGKSRDHLKRIAIGDFALLAVPLKRANAPQAIQRLEDSTQGQIDEYPNRVRKGRQLPRYGFRRGKIDAARRLFVQVDADRIGAEQGRLPAVVRTRDAANLDTQGIAPATGRKPVCKPGACPAALANEEPIFYRGFPALTIRAGNRSF